MKPIYRKFFHIITVSPFVILGFFVDSHIHRDIYIIISVILLVAFLGFEIYRLKNPSFREKIMKKFSYMYKKEDEKRIVSSIWGPVDLLILVLFFSKPTIVTTLCIGCYSDPIAAIVGTKYGGQKNKSGKTWAGTTAFFISSIILILIATSIINFTIPLLFVVVLSFIAAMLERYIPFGDDNFIVPMVFALGFEAIILFS